MWYGKRVQQNSVHNAENSGVGANAKGESENGDCRETRVAAKLPQSVAHILDNIFYPAQAVGVAAFFFFALHAAKGPERRIPGFFRRHPCLDVLLRLQLNVELKLLVQIALQTIAPEETCETIQQSHSRLTR